MNEPDPFCCAQASPPINSEAPALRAERLDTTEKERVMSREEIEMHRWAAASLRAMLARCFECAANRLELDAHALRLAGLKGAKR